MNSEIHELFRQQIDEMLVDASPLAGTQALRDHLQTCTECRQYLDTGRRAIAALSGFSFEVDPTLTPAITASLRHRARQLEGRSLRRDRWLLASTVALLLTAAGSLLDLQCSGLIASLLDIRIALVRDSLLHFWIVPSLCLLLIFPMLPLLSAAGVDRNERPL